MSLATLPTTIWQAVATSPQMWRSLCPQGMEFMSLCYAKEPGEEELDMARRLRLADSLGVYVGAGRLLQL